MIPLNTSDLSLIRVSLLIYNALGELDDTAAVSSPEQLQISINGAAWVDATGTLEPTGDGAYYYQGVLGDATTAGKLKVKFAKAGFLTSMAEEDVAEQASGGGGVVLRTGTAQAGGASSITLDAGASATNDFYKEAVIAITGGTGAGQVNTITAYAGGTKVATVNRAWAVQPDATSEFSVLPAPGTSTSSSVAAAVWSQVGEGAHAYGDLVRLLVGVLAGKTDNYTTGTIRARSLNDAKTRITWTVDETGRLTATIGDLT